MILQLGIILAIAACSVTAGLLIARKLTSVLASHAATRYAVSTCRDIDDDLRGAAHA